MEVKFKKDIKEIERKIKNNVELKLKNLPEPW